MGLHEGSAESDAAREHARSQARHSPSGIGAAVVRSHNKGEERAWECIVSDGTEWHYVSVEGVGVGPRPGLAPEDIEEGISCFAATLAQSGRLRHVLDADPLHIDRYGVVRD